MKALFLGQVTLSLRLLNGTYQVLKYVTLGKSVADVLNRFVPPVADHAEAVEGAADCPPYRVLSIMLELDFVGSTEAQALILDAVPPGVLDVGVGQLIKSNVVAAWAHSMAKRQNGGKGPTEAESEAKDE